MKVRREDLVRHLRHRFNTLLGVSLFSWLTMSGLMLFIWRHAQSLEIESSAWFVMGLLISVGHVLFLLFVAVRLQRTMEVRSRLLCNLEYESEHDSLTGLLNRRAFEWSLNEILRADGRQKGAFTLLYLDLDGFKQVNDVHGHAVGDELLKMLAGNWGRAIRGDDRLARLGGDEFVMLTRSTGTEVEQISERLLNVARTSLLSGFPDLKLGVSIGIAEFPRDGRDAASLVLAADSAMLKAKASGKARFQRAEHRAGDLLANTSVSLEMH